MKMDAASQLDSDGDGVTDDKDHRSDTPEGITVDENGCATSQLDSDGDGVTDDKDQCSDTPEGITVDENGCQIFTLTIQASPEVGGTVFPSSGNYEAGTKFQYMQHLMNIISLINGRGW